MTTTTMPTTPCPSCGELLDAATSMLEDAVPSDGDINVCIQCGHIMVFENGQPRNLTDAEMYQIAGDRRIIALQKVRGEVVAVKKRKDQK
jgi:hypothetical protein